MGSGNGHRAAAGHRRAEAARWAIHPPSARPWPHRAVRHGTRKRWPSPPHNAHARAHLVRLDPVAAVHGTERLLAGGNQVLVVALACGEAAVRCIAVRRQDSLSARAWDTRLAPDNSVCRFIPCRFPLPPPPAFLIPLHSRLPLRSRIPLRPSTCRTATHPPTHPTHP